MKLSYSLLNFDFLHQVADWVMSNSAFDKYVQVANIGDHSVTDVNIAGITSVVIIDDRYYCTYEELFRLCSLRKDDLEFLQSLVRSSANLEVVSLHSRISAVTGSLLDFDVYKDETMYLLDLLRDIIHIKGRKNYHGLLIVNNSGYSLGVEINCELVDETFTFLKAILESEVVT